MALSQQVPQAYTTTIGDGYHTQFTVEHHLNTMDTLVEVYDKDTGKVYPVQVTKTPNCLTVDTGRYHFQGYWQWGWLRIPNPFAKPIPYGPTIPAPDSLQVVVIG